MSRVRHHKSLVGLTVVILATVSACDVSTVPARPAIEPRTPHYEVEPARSAQQLGAMVAALYAPLSSSSVSVASVHPRGSLFEVILRQDGEEHSVFVTRDGRHIAERVSEVKAYRERLTRSLTFVHCAKAAGISVFVNSQQSDSLLQRRAFGPAADRLVIDCASSPRNCAKLGVRVFPSTRVGDVLHPGMRSTAFIETASGCKY